MKCTDVCMYIDQEHLKVIYFLILTEIVKHFVKIPQFACVKYLYNTLLCM